jgi:predicted PurR-regulated permease PerM
MASDQPPAPEPDAGTLLSPLLPPKQEQRGIFRWFFFVVFAFLLYQLLLILALFSDVIIWAGSLTLVFVPVYRYLQRHLPARRNTVAAVSTLGVLLLVLVPVLFMFWVVVQQSAELYPTVSTWLNELNQNGSASFVDRLPGFMQGWIQRASDYIDANPYLSRFDFEEFMLANVDAVSLGIANFGAATARNILLGLVNLILILILMYFCFRDGERFLQWLYQIVPMPSAHVEEIALRVYQTINAVISGALLTSGAQALLAIIGYMIAGVPLSVFFGVLTGICGMIPVVGAGLIWAPISVFIFLEEPGWGIFLALWCFFLVSLIDNFLKPILIGSQARMPILLVFCAIIGGLNVYGVTGVIIGPILIAVLLAFIGIYRDYYLPGHDRKNAQQAQPEPVE